MFAEKERVNIGKAHAAALVWGSMGGKRAKGQHQPSVLSAAKGPGAGPLARLRQQQPSAEAARAAREPLGPRLPELDTGRLPRGHRRVGPRGSHGRSRLSSHLPGLGRVYSVRGVASCPEEE